MSNSKKKPQGSEDMDGPVIVNHRLGGVSIMDELKAASFELPPSQEDLPQPTPADAAYLKRFYSKWSTYSSHLDTYLNAQVREENLDGLLSLYLVAEGKMGDGCDGQLSLALKGNSELFLSRLIEAIASCAKEKPPSTHPQQCLTDHDITIPPVPPRADALARFLKRGDLTPGIRVEAEAALSEALGFFERLGAEYLLLRNAMPRVFIEALKDASPFLELIRKAEERSAVEPIARIFITKGLPDEVYSRAESSITSILSPEMRTGKGAMWYCGRLNSLRKYGKHLPESVVSIMDAGKQDRKKMHAPSPKSPQGGGGGGGKLRQKMRAF